MTENPIGNALLSRQPPSRKGVRPGFCGLIRAIPRTGTRDPQKPGLALSAFDLPVFSFLINADCLLYDCGVNISNPLAVVVLATLEGAERTLLLSTVLIV